MSRGYNVQIALKNPSAWFPIKISISVSVLVTVSMLVVLVRLHYIKHYGMNKDASIPRNDAECSKGSIVTWT